MKFLGREKEKAEPSELFLENGSMFLQKLIEDCNGMSNPIRMFSSDQNLKATNHFDSYYLIPWYYNGIIEGRYCAIKKWYIGQQARKVYNDIVLSARVSNHSGFLKLIGCCLEFRLPVLVFENAEYGVLNYRGGLSSMNGLLLPWNVRLKIAKQVAIAVTYLHTAFPRIIIHRNINPLNVFLDKNWNAKLTEFSMSVTLPKGKTWIEDKPMGTFGYIDPLCYATNLVTEYTDVFSFGIFMLVLLIGRPPVLIASSSWKACSILKYVKDRGKRGKPIKFGGDSHDMRPGQMNKFLELALRCCEDRNEDRPKMILVAKELKLIERSLDC